MGRLDGKVAIVTGAGAGFGRGIVKKLTDEGARVLAADINAKGCTETADAAPDGSCVGTTADITLEEAWHHMLKTALSSFGKLDILVNCAGVVHSPRPSHEVPEDQFDLVFRVNVKPLYLSTKVIVKYWKDNGLPGNVINLSSISQVRPRPGVVWYAASKGAVTTTTQGLAAEYGVDKIRFNCIRPVVGRTAMLDTLLAGYNSPEAYQTLVNTVPLGRFCEPEDIGNMVCFLASDEASFITGAAFDVDGGRGVA